MKKFALGFTILAAMGVTACAQRDEPLTADNDMACRDRNGNIVDEDFCDDDNGGHAGMFLFMSSNGYHKKYGHYPKGYSPKAYAGKTTGGFRSSLPSTSRGGFGASGRGMSAGS
jgi:hypothetical protein